MSPPAIWLVAGLAVCCAEAVVPGVYLIWIGLGAAATGLALLAVPLSLGWQVLLFACCAALSVLCGRLWVRQHGAADPNAAASDLVGHHCRALVFDGTEGRVRFRDGEWPARSATGTANPGQALRIVGVDGNTLLVAPLA